MKYYLFLFTLQSISTCQSKHGRARFEQSFGEENEQLEACTHGQRGGNETGGAPREKRGESTNRVSERSARERQ